MIEITQPKEEKNKKKISFRELIKKINNTITGDMLANLAYSSMIMIYFLFFNIEYEYVSIEILTRYINTSSIVFLGITLILIEISYRKEEINTLIYGLEFMVLSIFTLLIQHIPKLIQCNTQTYILIGSYMFALYYMLKSTVIYTKEKEKELANLSDIKEIVKEVPIKKASKRKNKKENV